jgi:hypothetical protein
MFEDVEIMQRITALAVAFTAAILFFWFWGRREERRTRALDLSEVFAQWGLDALAKFFRAYGIGNYIGKDSVARTLREIYHDVKGSGLPAMLRKVGWKIVEGVFLKNAADRAKLAELLAKPYVPEEKVEPPAPSLPAA